MNHSVKKEWCLRKAVIGLSPLLLLILFCPPAFSQSNLGRIYGSITDQTAGVIAGATVTVTDVARGIARPLSTDRSGEYSAGSLIPGTYTVRAEAMGFRALERTDILLNVGGDVRVDLTLQPGEQSETVTVTGELPMINTSNATLGGQIEQTQINEIPLNGRNYLHLLDYKPGMVSAPGGGSNTHASNGQRTDANVWVVDGIYNGDLATGWPVVNGFGVGGGPDPSVTLPLDAILELNLQSNPKAEYGYKPGAVVQVGLKSGTNAIHGGIFAFGRDRSFNARNPFEGPGEKAPFAMTQWGGTVGGPIIKDKLFYFGGLEYYNYNVAATADIPVPTSMSLGGNAANSIPDALYDIYHNGANTLSVPARQLSMNLAGCGSLMPTDLASMTAIEIQNACNPALNIFNNNQSLAAGPHPEVKTFSYPSIGGSSNYLVKMDYHINDHHSVNGEYFIGDGNTLAWTNNKSVQPYWLLNSKSRAQVIRGVWIWIPNSTMLNEARFGYDRLVANETNNDCVSGPDWQSVYGFDTGTGAYSCAFPTTAISGFGDSTQQVLNLDQGDGPLLNISGNWSGVDNISYTRGNHQFKFGGEIHMGGFKGTGGGGPGPLPHGNLAFGTTHAWTGSTALEDFLTGTLSSAKVAVGPIIGDVRLNYYSAFVQDDWRLTPTFTANLGVRYEYATPFRERNGLIGNLDINSTTTGLVQQTSSQSIFRGDKNNFSPRLGFAWDIAGNGTTVIRGGASILYSTTSWSGFSDTLTVPTGAIFSNPDGSTFNGGGTITTAVAESATVPWIANPATTAQTLFGSLEAIGTGQCGNGQAYADPDGDGPLTAGVNPAPCSFLAIDPNLYTPYVTNWNIGIQHAFGSNVSLDLGYVGNHSSGLRLLGDINEPTLGAKGTSNEQKRRPFTTNCPVGSTPGGAGTDLLGGGCYPWLGQVRYLSNSGVSNYNAFQVSLTTRNFHGLSTGTNFTYLSYLNQFVGNENVINRSPLMANDMPRLDYGRQSVPYNFTATINYAIPGVQGYAQMLQGWAINTSITIRGAAYLTAFDTNGDYSGSGNKRDRWTIMGDPNNIKLGGFAGVPCYGVTGSRFAGQLNCTEVADVTLMPSLCRSAAAAEPSGTGTGTAQLAAVGCYYQNGTAIVPPAAGTFGTMGIGALRGSTYRNMDLSVTKTWRFKERYSAEFRAEFFNVLNLAQYNSPSSNPNNAGSFGNYTSTPNSGNGIVIGGGGPRAMQLALKLGF